MIENPLLMRSEGDEVIPGAGVDSMMAHQSARDRLIYAGLMALISLCWASLPLSLVFFAACVVWEFGVRPPLRDLITSRLIQNLLARKILYYACLVFAATLYAGMQMYALFSGHPLGWIVITITYCSSAMASIGYMSRSRGTFIATMAPMTLATFSAPFVLHAGLVNTIAVELLNGLVISAALMSMRHNSELIADIAAEGEARVQAEMSNTAKSQFLATMSHELRTPLNAIIGYSEMMKEGAQDDGRALDVEDHDKVIRAAHSLLMLINDVLDISKIEAGKMQLKIEPFDLAGLVSEAAATAAPLAKRNSNKFEVHAASNLGVACSDSFRLNQCLLNLLSNAAKFTKNGVVRLDAYRAQKDGADQIVFEISDTGIGMSAEQMEHLFQPFAQADSNITRAYGGTGLGLAITQRIANMLGGEVEAKSDKGCGSLFTLRVPADYHAAVHANEQEDGAAPSADGRPLALVIDDDAHTQELAQRHLEGSGIAVLCAGRGAEGVQLARAHQPSIIVLDINLPDQSGWRMLEDFRADADFAETPILVVSIEDDRQRALKLGACDLLTKPVGKAAFVAAVMRYARACPLQAPAAPHAAKVRALG